MKILWMAQSLRWGAALLAGIIGGAVVFKAGRYIVRQQVAGDLGRVLHAEQVEKLLVGNGQELPGELRHAMQSARLNDRDARKLLTLLDQQRINIEQEADLLAKWDKHVVRLRDALQQGNMFVFKDTFDTSLTNLRNALRRFPASKQELVALDQLSKALRRNKLSKNQALRKLTSLESRVHKQVGKLLEEDWDKAMQQARQALERSKDFDGRPAVRKGLQTMKRPLDQLDKQPSTRRLQRLAQDGTLRADKMKEEIHKIFSKIEAIRTRHLRAAGVRSEAAGKLNHRDELLRVLQDLELAARNSKKNGRARKLQRLAKDIQEGKVDQSKIAKRMHSIDRDWQLVKDSDSAEAWRRGLGKVDAILTADRSINNYKQLQVALRDLQHLLQEIGDKGSARKISKLESEMTKRLGRKRSVSSRELDKFSERAMVIVNRSRKHNKLRKTVEQLEKGSEEVESGLADSGMVRPKHALQSSLNTLESVLQKLVAEDELVLLRELRADIAAKRLSREELANNLAVFDDMLRQGKQATAFKYWQTNLTQVKANLGSNSNLYELNPDFAGIWDEMTTTLQASKLRATFADEVKELQRYTLNGNWQEGALDNKLNQIDTKVRNTGSFRTADELLAVQGKERRAARKELRQRLAELRRELRVGGKTKAAPLGTALREGEKTRKAKQGSFSWFKYGEGGERVINRAQVLTALRDGDQLPAIEVQMGLEKLAAQLTGATIFVALPFMFDNDKPQSGQLVPLLQRMAQAVDAEITPTAQCWLGECVTTD